MLMQGEIITLDNDREYTVVFSTMYENNNYIYAINNNDIEDVTFFKCEDDSVYEVEDSDMNLKLMNLFYEFAEKELKNG